jgi:ankyrin repeat protein
MTVSPILSALYEDRTSDAEALASETPSLDVFEAAALGRADRLRELLDADPSLAQAWAPDGFQALHLAAFFGHADAAEALLEHGADPSVVSRHEFVKVTPLHSAVASEGAEDLRTVEVLLAHGAPVNGGVEGRHTPLHSAAYNGNTAIVKALLAAGADPTLAKDDGKTPMDLAREQQHEDVLKIGASNGPSS